jgi:hypothetical protein
MRKRSIKNALDFGVRYAVDDVDSRHHDLFVGLGFCTLLGELHQPQRELAYDVRQQRRLRMIFHILRSGRMGLRGVGEIFGEGDRAAQARQLTLLLRFGNERPVVTGLLHVGMTQKTKVQWTRGSGRDLSGLDRDLIDRAAVLAAMASSHAYNVRSHVPVEAATLPTN